MNEHDTRRLALGDALRQWREAAGLSGKELATQAGWTPSKVSRVERAKQSVADSDILAYAERTGASDEAAAELRQELREIRLEEASWSRQLRAGHHARQEYSQQIERNAQDIQLFEVAVVPGLVQTAEYARYVFTTGATLHGTPQDTGDAVRARMARQDALFDTSKSIKILCAESALRHTVAPASVMAGQLDRLLALSGMSTARLAILPLDVTLPASPLHGFVLVDDLVLVETINTEMSVTEESELAKFRWLFDQLWNVAAEGPQAREILQRLISRYTEQVNQEA